MILDENIRAGTENAVLEVMWLNSDVVAALEAAVPDQGELLGLAERALYLEGVFSSTPVGKHTYNTFMGIVSALRSELQEFTERRSLEEMVQSLGGEYAPQIPLYPSELR